MTEWKFVSENYRGSLAPGLKWGDADRRTFGITIIEEWREKAGGGSEAGKKAIYLNISVSRIKMLSI